MWCQDRLDNTSIARSRSTPRDRSPRIPTGSSQPSYAASHAPPPTFDEMDVNRDGVVDRQEWRAAHADRRPPIRGGPMAAAAGPSPSSSSLLPPRMRDPSPKGTHDADLRRDNTALREKVSRLEGQVAHYSAKQVARFIISRWWGSRTFWWQEIYAAAMADRFVFTSELRACKMETMVLQAEKAPQPHPEKFPPPNCALDPPQPSPRLSPSLWRRRPWAG